MTDDDRYIGPTPERLRRAGRDVEAFTPDESLHHHAIRMLDGHVLERLASRKVIGGDLYNSGLRFYSDWYYAGLAASGVIDPSRVVVDGGQPVHESDRRLAALTRWKRAVVAVGLIHCTVLSSVLLNEESLENYGRRRYGHKARKLAILAATTALIDGLTALDHHYHGPRDVQTRASHTADYRPGIPPPARED